MAAISAGGRHSCALTSAGGIQCWGSADSSQIGDGSTLDRLTPVAIRSGQSISFTPAGSAGSGTMLAVTATASGGLTPINFDTWTPAICSISGSTLSLTGAPGSLCGVRASQPGAAPLPAGGSVAPAPQQLRLIRITTVSSTSLTSNLNPSTFGANVTLTAQVAGSLTPLPTGTVTFMDGASTLATVALNGSASAGASYSSTSLTVGSHSVTASYGGDVNNASSMTTLTQVVNKIDQVIVFGSPPSLSVGGTGTVSATGGASGNAVTFTSATPSICTVSGATVTAVAAGNCSIAANQLGNGNYNAATQALQTITVSNGIQTITGFTPATPVMFGAAAQILSATLGISSSPLVFTVGSGPCLVVGTSLSYSGAGSCVLAVNQAADANYNAAAPLSATVVVNKANQVITFGSPPSLSLGGTGTVSATGGASGNPVIFSSTTPSVCTVSGATVTNVAAGSCVVAANQAANSNYNAAPQATQSFVVAVASSQSAVSSSLNPSTSGQAVTFVFTVTQLPAVGSVATVPTGTVTFSDNGTVLATRPLDANGQASYTVVPSSPGNHIITASYNGDSNNAPSSVSVNQQINTLIVPTLSGWMLLLLALLLGAAALRLAPGRGLGARLRY